MGKKAVNKSVRYARATKKKKTRKRKLFVKEAVHGAMR